MPTGKEAWGESSSSSPLPSSSAMSAVAGKDRTNGGTATAATAATGGGGANGVRHTVRWVDLMRGKDLAEVVEFVPSETSSDAGSDYGLEDDRPGCQCTIS